MARIRSLLALIGIFSVVASGLIFLTSTRTQAGFEWVPAKKQSPMPAMENMQQQSSPVVIEPENEGLLPEEMVLTPPQTINTPQVKVVKEPEFQPVEIEVQVPQTPPSTMKTIRPGEEVKQSYQPRPRRVVMPEPVEDSIEWNSEPIEAVANIQKAPAEEVKTLPTKTKIFMPEDAPHSAMSASSSPYKESVKINATPAIEAAAESSNAEPVTEVMESEDQNYDMINGFANNIPLAFALSQIVPDGYAYSLGRQVDPSLIVSWNGGKPWPAVIQEMIEPLSLSMGLKGKTLLIFNQDVSGAPALEKHSHAEGLVLKTSSAEKIATQASGAPITIADINTNGETRTNIQTPSADISAQPSQTMKKIEAIATQSEAQKPQNSQTFDLISPASGAAEPSDQSYREKKFWKAKKGESAKDVLSAWSNDANVELVWDAPHDYTLSNNILINDDYENALIMLLGHAINDEQTPSMTLLETANADRAAKVIIK